MCKEKPKQIPDKIDIATHKCYRGESSVLCWSLKDNGEIWETYHPSFGSWEMEYDKNDYFLAVNLYGPNGIEILRNPYNIEVVHEPERHSIYERVCVEYGTEMHLAKECGADYIELICGVNGSAVIAKLKKHEIKWLIEELTKAMNSIKD